jgi:TRAP-type C4-dicarboxylate transport system substrate-binding protein
MVMKKSFSVLLMVVLIGLLAACGGSSKSSAGEEKSFKFKLGFTFNPTDYRAQSAIYFTELVAERSGGKITFETFPSEQLVQGRESLQGVSQGIIDMYMTSSSYITGLVPAVVVYDLPQLVGRDIPETMLFVNSLMEETETLIAGEFKKAGVELVGVLSQSGPTEMIFTKPVRTMEDFVGKKIRTVGGTTDRILQNLKASPVFIGSSEVYMGLQTCVVDGSVTTATTILGSKLYEICHYLTQPTISAGLSPYFLIMNEDQWAALSDNQKALLKQATKDTLIRNLDVYPEVLLKEREEALSKFTEVSTLSPEEFKKISDTAIVPLWDELLKDVTPVTKQIADMRRAAEYR